MNEPLPICDDVHGRHFWYEVFTDGDTCACGKYYLSQRPQSHGVVLRNVVAKVTEAAPQSREDRARDWSGGLVNCTCRSTTIGSRKGVVRDPQCPTHGGAVLRSKPCPYCDRIMSVRETQQGACDDCARKP